MALTKGVNSYATVAEADAYFSDRLDVAAWTNASDAQKAQALITATHHLDSQRWIGSVSSADQKLMWPRRGMYYDARLGRTVYLKGDEVPLNVVRATFEMAYHLLNNDGLYDDTGSVETIKVGSIELQKIQRASKFPRSVWSLLSGLVEAGSMGGGPMWWRAN